MYVVKCVEKSFNSWRDDLTKCCGGWCFLNCGPPFLAKYTKVFGKNADDIDVVEYAACIVGHCRNLACVNKTRDEKNKKLLDILSGCFRGVTEKGYARLEIRIIPEGPPVCRRAFCIAFDIGESTFHSLVEKIKCGAVSAVPTLSDRSAIAPTLNLYDEIGQRWSIVLEREQVSAMVISNTSESLFAYTWLDDLFRFIGDHMPNLNEIHLDSVTIKKEIFVQYMKEQQALCIPHLKYSRFIDVWNACFPYVKIRQYKVWLMHSLKSQPVYTNFICNFACTVMIGSNWEVFHMHDFE